MKVLNRARHLYSEEYIVSDSIKFELNQMYLFHKNRWTECEESTRSINFENMIDKNGKKIFASLSEDGVGGDVLNYKDIIVGYDKHNMMFNAQKDSYAIDMENLDRFEVIGIHKGEL